MTKIQLATKAVWNGLMLITFGWVLARFQVISSNTYQVSIWRDIIISIVLCILLAFIFRLWMNFKLPLQLSGLTTIVIESDSRTFFMQMQRLCYVFAGLILLSGSVNAIKGIFSLLKKIFPTIQSWISLWVSGDFSGAMEQTFIGIQRGLYPFGYILVAIYLICGADRLVHWQVNLLDTYMTKGSCNE